MLRGSILPAVAVAVLAAAPQALAKSYRISTANETFQIEANGSIQATERLTFVFQGAFHGAYRLIPVAGNERIDHVEVSDGGFPDSPDGSALVGSSGDPGTFGTMTTDQGWKQIAWHFDATDTTRTFVVSYRMSGYIRDYQDIGNLYLQVWGSQWPVPVTQLHVEVLLPGSVTSQESKSGLFRVWGHPASVKGSVALVGSNEITVDSQSIPAKRFVEIDAAFPSRLLSTDSKHLAGNGLALVVAREQRIFSSPYGPGEAAAAAPATSSGGGGISGIFKFLLALVLLPIVLIARLFGFGGGKSSGGGGGLGGSFGGGGGGGSGGGGGGAW